LSQELLKKELLTFLISIFENGDFCILIIQCTGKHQSNTRKAPAYARNTHRHTQQMRFDSGKGAVPSPAKRGFESVQVRFWRRHTQLLTNIEKSGIINRYCY